MPASVAPFLRPRSIAVIGATNRRESLGGKVILRLFAAGFTGRIFPVNPKQPSIHSTKCYASVSEIPDEVDLAIVLVPRDACRAAVEECCRKGVKGVVVITAGFGEVDAAGRRRQEELTEMCRAHGARLLGPNCMGVINTHPEIALDATFTPTPALPGPIGFLSQSGALGVAVLNICQERGIGFSQFVSLGNKADLTENDFLEAWEDDPEVPVITVYLESFSDAGRFLELSRRIARKKPIVLVKAGRTEAGARAASSHTGALAAADTGAEALRRQAGIIRAATVQEMLDVAMLLSRCPLPRGRNVAVLTNAGGPAILAADALSQLGLALPPLQEETQAKLRAILPREAAVTNPVDMIASAGPPQFAQCLQLLLDDPGVDAVISITVTPPLFSGPLDTLKAMLPVFKGAAKPALGVFMAGEEFYGRLSELPAPPPIYKLPEDAARALAAVVGYSERRAAPPAELREHPADRRAIGEILGRRKAAGGGWLAPEDTFQVLALAGVPVAPWRVAGTPEEAVAGARACGFPVVVKAVSSAIVHKSDLGGVALDLRDAEQVKHALARMTEALLRAGQPRGSWSWLVQAFRPGGREVIIGASRDPHYGPLVMFGLGGKYVEVFGDVRFSMTPVARQDAEEMVRSIHGLALLTGARGEAGVDLGPAIEAIERVAELVRRRAEIAELDINPLLLFPAAGDAVAVDARIRVAS